jgi:hypothetical protein
MTMGTRVPDWLVEKVHLGEASEEERAIVMADADARARLEALPAANVHFFERFPADEELRRIAGKARTADAAEARSNRAAITWGLAGPLLAAGLALLLVGMPGGITPPGVGPDGITQVKGPENTKADPKLRVYRKRSSGIERVGEGALAREGDVLQLGMVSGGAQHGVVVSLDGRGAVTLHFPRESTGPTKLGSGEQHATDGYELDDAPEFERFFFVTTSGPADVSSVMHAAEALAATGNPKTEALPLPRGYQQTSVLIRKEAR